MFIDKSSTEIVVIDEEIKFVGLNLQKSGLPISFESLGKLCKVKIDREFFIEVYPREEYANNNFEMYTLTPIKE